MLMDWHLQALQTISLMKGFFQILELFFEWATFFEIIALGFCMHGRGGICADHVL